MPKNRFDSIKGGKRVAIWGMGQIAKKKSKLIKEYIDPIVCVDSDSNVRLGGGAEEFGDLKCIAPDELEQYQIDIVVITPEKMEVIHEISAVIGEKYEIFTLNEILDDVYISLQEGVDFGEESSNIKHFSCSVGSCQCNLDCPYCYLDFRDSRLKYNQYFSHSIPFMLKAVSRKRLGGVAFFHLVGDGETLLKPGIIELVHGLLSEGHYVGINTNGTVRTKIDELLKFDEKLQKHLLIECSCHYLELKKQNMLDAFFDNINKLKNSSISFDATMVGVDEYIPYIGEIRDTFISKIGLLPVISPVRTDTTYQDGFPLGSKLSWDEYAKVWSDFPSKAIEIRAKTLGKIEIPCYAGINSGVIDFESGRLGSCVPGDTIDNIYSDITSRISFLKESHGCKWGFCSHCIWFLSGREIGNDVLPTSYQTWVNIDMDGKISYSDEVRKAMDICRDY